MSEFVKVAEIAARKAGSLLQSLRGRVNIREKGPRDLVTEADLAAQRTIREVLLDAFPDHGFVGEEQGGDSSSTGGSPTGGSPIERADAKRPANPPFCWVVDPLDGTTNFAHQLPMYAVSIALRKFDESAESGQFVAGVVFDPSLDEMFSVTAGGPALLNGQAIATSNCQDLRAGLVAASFAANVVRGSIEIERFVEMLHSCRAVRRMGSAALNLSYVAAGRLDAYWATSVKTWDVAAGLLLVERAGGVVTDLNGAPVDLDRPVFAAAATPQLHARVLETLDRARL